MPTGFNPILSSTRSRGFSGENTPNANLRDRGQQEVCMPAGDALCSFQDTPYREYACLHANMPTQTPYMRTVRCTHNPGIIVQCKTLCTRSFCSGVDPLLQSILPTYFPQTPWMRGNPDIKSVLLRSRGGQEEPSCCQVHSLHIPVVMTRHTFWLSRRGPGAELERRDKRMFV